MSKAKLALALTWGAVLTLSPTGAFAYSPGSIGVSPNRGSGGGAGGGSAPTAPYSSSQPTGGSVSGSPLAGSGAQGSGTGSMGNGFSPTSGQFGGGSAPGGASGLYGSRGPAGGYGGTGYNPSGPQSGANGYKVGHQGNAGNYGRPGRGRKVGQRGRYNNTTTTNNTPVTTVPSTKSDTAMPKIAAQQETIFYGAALTWIKNNQGHFRADWKYPGPIVLSDGSPQCKVKNAYQTVNLNSSGLLPQGWTDRGAKGYCAALYLNVDGNNQSSLVLFTPGLGSTSQTQLTSTQTEGAMANGMLNSKAVSKWFPNAQKASAPLAFSAFKVKGTNRWIVYKPQSGVVAHASQASGAPITQQTAQSTKTSKQTIQASQLPKYIKNRLISAFNGS